MAISRSVDGGHTWQNSRIIEPPTGCTFATGEDECSRERDAGRHEKFRGSKAPLKFVFLQEPCPLCSWRDSCTGEWSSGAVTISHGLRASEQWSSVQMAPVISCCHPRGRIRKEHPLPGKLWRRKGLAFLRTRASCFPRMLCHFFTGK